VRSFAARALQLRGYTVIEASSGEEALEILNDEDLRVDIMVSDVIMPGLDGPAWVREARKARPDVKVIFVSGYAEDVFGGGESGIPNSAFLPKPFTLPELTQKVKDLIEA
jgi:two-component system cell cycle sensor histidine kinase/response regulator CckA